MAKRIEQKQKDKKKHLIDKEWAQQEKFIKETRIYFEFKMKDARTPIPPPGYLKWENHYLIFLPFVPDVGSESFYCVRCKHLLGWVGDKFTPAKVLEDQDLLWYIAGYVDQMKIKMPEL